MKRKTSARIDEMRQFVVVEKIQPDKLLKVAKQYIEAAEHARNDDEADKSALRAIAHLVVYVELCQD